MIHQGKIETEQSERKGLLRGVYTEHGECVRYDWRVNYCLSHQSLAITTGLSLMALVLKIAKHETLLGQVI